jgi:hypothetical protein
MYIIYKMSHELLNSYRRNIASFVLSLILTLFVLYSNRNSLSDVFFNFSSLIALSVLGLTTYVFIQEMREKDYIEDVATWSKNFLLVLLFVSGYYASFNNKWLTYSSDAGINVGQGILKIGNQGVGVGRGLVSVGAHGVDVGHGLVSVGAHGVNIGKGY